MYGTRVNPMTVAPGSRIATSFAFSHNDTHTGDEVLHIKKTRVVKKVSFCESSPESVHLDHECYDSRFTTVVKPLS